MPASEGGGSFYADGFAVAERLRKEHPEAFDFFTKTSLTYQTYDAGYHYVTDGPIFRMGPHGVVDQVHMLYRTLGGKARASVFDVRMYSATSAAGTSSAPCRSSVTVSFIAGTGST